MQSTGIERKQFLSAKVLIRDYRKLQNVRSKQFKDVRNLIRGFTQPTNDHESLFAKLTCYDMFRTFFRCINLNEDAVTDVIASLLDPSRSPWGKKILLSLLQGDKELKKSKVFSIISRSEDNRFISHLRPRDDESAIDLEIQAEYRDRKAAVAFEFKRTWGSETINNGGHQTSREWEALCRNMRITLLHTTLRPIVHTLTAVVLNRLVRSISLSLSTRW